ncbi:MAG TPA: hypothetical protein VKB95_04495, partial [Chitinophagaceae bacterium]|nr:hypothetical protein [Chitinophagaceae bacterium]
KEVKKGSDLDEVLKTTSASTSTYNPATITPVYTPPKTVKSKTTYTPVSIPVDRSRIPAEERKQGKQCKTIAGSIDR